MTTQTRKKVLLLITKSNWGGAQRYVYDLATHIDKNKFEVVVALGGGGLLVEMLKSAHIRVITITSLQRDVSLKKEWQFAKELRQIIRSERPDILHVNSSKAGIIGTLFGRLLRVHRVIFTSHGWAFNEDRSIAQKLVIKFLHYLTVLMSHKTIAVSKASVDQMNWPGAQKKMKIINPGRTIGVMYDKSAAREKIVDFSPTLIPYVSDTWIVCVAELHPIKRHTILFSAFHSVSKKYPRARLICIGDGELMTTLKEKIAALDMREQIFLLGNVPEAARFLKAFDFFVLASQSESYGYVLHEAGLASIPVIATNVGGIPDIITNNKTGLLVQPNDVSALSTAMETYLQQPAKALEYAKSLQQLAKARSVEQMTLTTESLYSTML